MDIKEKYGWHKLNLVVYIGNFQWAIGVISSCLHLSLYPKFLCKCTYSQLNDFYLYMINKDQDNSNNFQINKKSIETWKQWQNFNLVVSTVLPLGIRLKSAFQSFLNIVTRTGVNIHVNSGLHHTCYNLNYISVFPLQHTLLISSTLHTSHLFSKVIKRAVLQLSGIILKYYSKCSIYLHQHVAFSFISSFHK